MSEHRCPWCSAPLSIDAKRWPFGDPKVIAHLEQCPLRPIKRHHPK